MAVANCWGFAWLRNKRVVEIVFILFAVSEQWAAKLDFCVCCRLRTNFDLIWFANGISFSIAFIGGLWIFVFRLLSSLSLSLVRVLWSPFLQLTNNLINFIFGVFECRKNNSIQSVQVFWCVFCVCVCVAGLWANLKEAQRIRSQNRSEAAAGKPKACLIQMVFGWLVILGSGRGSGSG